MFRRRISAEEIRLVLETGKVIEDYPDDQPFPSKLVLGYVARRPLHVVVAEDWGTGTCIIVTAYEPEHDLWEAGFERRRQ
jgi:hypothetical protein